MISDYIRDKVTDKIKKGTAKFDNTKQMINCQRILL